MKFRGIGRLRKIRSRIGFRLKNRVVVLLYHRVADLQMDPQLLAVSPSNFASHLDVITSQYRALSLRDLAESVRCGKVPHRGVVITFDDGYLDNLTFAKPLMEQYQVPSAIFVSSGADGNRNVFWWDELTHLFFNQPNLPESITLTIKGRSLRWALGCNFRSKDKEVSGRHWSVLSEQDPTPAHSAYRDLCQHLRLLDTTEREGILASIRQQTGGDCPLRNDSRAMTRAELSDLIRGDHIEIGAHTVSHVQLSAISKERQIEEIKNSKQALQEITGAPVTSFSYPYGERNHYTQETIDIVKRDRFLCACSNFEEVVTRTTDPFQIPRFVVRNWDRGEFAAKLDDWFTQPRE